MSGKFTRKMYDGCSYDQNTKQSTDPLELVLDVTKYVHCNNICKPNVEHQPNSALLVDVESSLWGIDKVASDCDTSKHPFCGPNGCLLTKDPRVPPHVTPYLCERGKDNDRAVITTNMKMPTHPGYTVPDPNICNGQGNGYYYDPSHPRPVAPRPPAPRAPLSRAPLPPVSKQPLAPLSKQPVFLRQGY